MNRTLLVALLVSGGCSMWSRSFMQQDYRTLLSDISTAQVDQWAEICAPRELALAQTHRQFAEIEFREGDPRRAQEHLLVADENIKIALERAEACRPKDRDKDGIFDDDDQCPDEPEDFDGDQDEDGCPDSDRDADGIGDDVDACPDNPEDKDGFEDEDGCPDVDNDKDGIIDAADSCPNDPEDKDGFEDGDGCPDVDNDKDTILDVNDQCPNDPEDFDGDEDTDGCPDAVGDTDGDGYADNVDKCPKEPENFNQYLDEDGCPDIKPQNVRVTKDKIEIDQKVFFEVNKAVIKPVSFGILNEVAQAMRDYPHLNIRVEGHTDSDGSDDYNMKLSQARAESVMQYLIGQGITSARLTAQGYGETRPIDTNRTADGKANNRRVEFVITNPN